MNMRNSSVRVTIHAGEPGASIPATRERIERVWGAKAYDHAGMTEMGAFGFACSQQEGLHVNEGEFIAEILNPQNGRPVREGQTGELVLTNLGRWGSPALRYRTGDLVRHGGYACECGRTFLHLPGGVLGRVDDMIIVRGVNVYPSALANVLHSFPEVAEYRIIVTREGSMDEIALQVECPSTFASAIQDALHIDVDGLLVRGVEMAGPHEPPGRRPTSTVHTIAFRFDDDAILAGWHSAPDRLFSTPSAAATAGVTAIRRADHASAVLSARMRLRSTVRDAAQLSARRRGRLGRCAPARRGRPRGRGRWSG